MTEIVFPNLEIVTTKQLARLNEIWDHNFTEWMKEVNQVADQVGLEKYMTYSRIWEYPWIWSKLRHLQGNKLQVLDIGSERSPFPWFLAIKGFKVIVSDNTARFWNQWKKANQYISQPIKKYILDAQNLDMPTASVDIYLSVSVIEHISNKEKTIQEAARILRPGGLLIMSFDICEPDMGMKFPSWNGIALTMSEFDALFEHSSWFELGLSDLKWNRKDITDYLSWHKTTAPHHNYVTGGAVIKRNMRLWETRSVEEHLRCIRRAMTTWFSVIKYRFLHEVLRDRTN